MAASPGAPPPDRPAVYALALALLLVASLATFLAANDYPLLSAEAGLLLGACLAAGAALGAVARFGMRTVAALLLGGAVAFCIELLHDLEGHKAALLLVPAACLAAAWCLRRHLAAVVAAASFVWLTTTLVIPATTPEGQAGEHRPPIVLAGAAAEALPVIVHIILDEHIGIDGVPPEIAASAAFKRELADFYVGRGFRIDAGAYSEYIDTRNSLANLLNFTSMADPWAHLAGGKSRPYVLERSAYFEQLRAQGYRLRIYQSDYIDFCRIPGVAYAACARYSSHKIGSISRTSLGSIERAQFIFHSFFSSSYYFHRTRQSYEKLRSWLSQAPLPAWNEGPSRVGPIPVLPVLAELEGDLRRATRGTVYFAHLLIPHYPYVLDESCRLREETDDWLYNGLHLSEAAMNTEQSRKERYLRYFEQVGCQQKLLERLFGAMQEAGVWEDAIVIVHGDHGSRILRRVPTTATAEQLSADDLRDAYSTLFAIRAPGTAAGVRSQLQPLQHLLGEALGVPVADAGGKVYLRGDNGKNLRPRAFEGWH